jgi:Na+/phosphate symporter
MSLARKINAQKIVYGLAGLFFFILAIQLMKAGAKKDLADLLRQASLIRNPFNALGFGWLGAYFVLSGSPVAAATLGLFNGGAINTVQAFMMINGSRMGASFIVLFIGFIYILRGQESKRSMGMGLISLLTTWTTYIPAMALGYLILANGWLNWFHPSSGGQLASVIDAIFDPIVAWIVSWAPGLLVFVVGVGLVMFAFNLIDRALPELKLSGTGFGEAPRLLYRPIVMFGLGMAVTSVSMSVSVSLGLLVPLSARGYVRAENVVPYIMGANVTTFVDTLVASLLMNNPAAFTIVLVEMLSVAITSVVILRLSYHGYERFVLNIVGAITRSRRNQAIFMLTLVASPIVLLLL